MVTFKKGETVVDLSSGQQFKIEDGDIDLDPGKYGRIAPGSTVSKEDVIAGARQAGIIQAPSRDEALLKKASDAAVNEASKFNKSMWQNVGVPAAQAALGMATGGMSLPAQALIGGGAELAAQGAGLSPESKAQVGLAAAVPLAGPAIVNGVKGAGKAVGKLLSPSATRNAGVEAGVEQLGGISDVVTRVKTKPQSKLAYEQVEATFDEVPTNIANRGITSALNKIPASSDSKAARDYLKLLSDTLDAEPSLPYERMAAEIQGMRKKAIEFARNNDDAGAAAIRQARQNIMAEMEKVSPDLANANALYSREKSIGKIEDALTKPRADVAFRQLVKTDKLVAAMPEEDLRMVDKIAKQLSSIGSSMSPFSSSGRVINFLATPLAGMIESDMGRAFLRKMFKEGGNVTPAGISTALQFWRAYEAQNQGGQ